MKIIGFLRRIKSIYRSIIKFRRSVWLTINQKPRAVIDYDLWYCSFKVIIVYAFDIPAPVVWGIPDIAYLQGEPCVLSLIGNNYFWSHAVIIPDVLPEICGHPRTVKLIRMIKVVPFLIIKGGQVKRDPVNRQIAWFNGVSGLGNIGLRRFNSGGFCYRRLFR